MIAKITSEQFLAITANSIMPRDIRLQLYTLLCSPRFKDTIAYPKARGINSYHIYNIEYHSLSYDIDARFEYHNTVFEFILANFSIVYDKIKDYDQHRFLLISLFLLALNIDYYEIKGGVIIDKWSFDMPGRDKALELWYKAKCTYHTLVRNDQIAE